MTSNTLMASVLAAAISAAACTDTSRPTGLDSRTPDGSLRMALSGGGSPGAVYVMTNDPTSNQIAVFARGADGTLTFTTSVATGGRGSGTIENNANPLILGEQSPNNLNGGYKYLYGVNAGSNSISVFRTVADGLELVEVESSGGDHPISVTVHNNLLYVLNGGTTNCMGGSPTITGFRIRSGGELEPIAGSTRPVSGGALSGCAQISFTPDGGILVVSERAADKIDTYIVDRGTGVADGPIVNETTGNGPFGFSFTQRGQLFTTENFGGLQFQGGAASYDVNRDGTIVPLGPTARNGRSDTCWLVITDDGRFAFVTNFQSGDISSYAINRDGSLALLNPIAATIGLSAADQAMSGNSKYLYARTASDGKVHSFSIEKDGSLLPIDVDVLPPSLGTTGGIGIAAK